MSRTPRLLVPLALVPALGPVALGPVALGLVACGGSPGADPSSAPAPESPTSVPETADPGAQSSSDGTSSSASADASPPPKGAERPLRPAATTAPEGVSALTEVERKELSGPCKKLVDAMAKVVGKRKVDPSASRTEQVIEALDDPPKIEGVDVARCAGLMRRDLVAFAASQSEREVQNDLKIIAVNLGVAFESKKALCPSAGPSPASLDAVAKGPVMTAASDWAAPGWACVRFGPTTPVRWQYELVTDAKAGTYEVIARGFPVKGAPAAELVIVGTVEASGPTPPGALQRR